jgi:hypothetical protein
MRYFMNSYLVTWRIDIEADTPLDAAREALRIQRKTDSIATVFTVNEHKGEPLDARDGIEIDLEGFDV